MKTFELLGLAGFNVFLGMMLTVTLFDKGEQPKASRMTEASINAFINDMTHMALGLKPEMDQYATTMWFMDHLSETSKFKTNTNIEQADGRIREARAEMGRMDYISNILKEQKTVQKRATQVKVEYVKIEDEGKMASVIFTSEESGMIPLNSEAGSYEVPVRGTSFCEHQLEFKDHKIIVAGGTCTTNIDARQAY